MVKEALIYSELPLPRGQEANRIKGPDARQRECGEGGGKAKKTARFRLECRRMKKPLCELALAFDY